MTLIVVLPKRMNNESGFVLVGAMLILLLLMLIGISASNTATMEVHIAGSDRVRKETFSQADGGVQMAVRLVEESLGTPGGFTAVNATGILLDPFNPNNTIFIANLSISGNNGVPNQPTDAARDAAYFPDGYDATNTSPHTNITAAGVTSTTEGAGLQMIAGYEGKGKGVAGGGGQDPLHHLFSAYGQSRE